MKIDNTIFIVETEESESAHETAEQKIKKLIEDQLLKVKQKYAEKIKIF